MKIKLADALLRRKELQEKVDVVRQLKPDGDNFWEVKVKRQMVTDSIEDVRAAVPKITIQQVTAAFDWHAKQLRKIDAAIQQANWITEIDIDEIVMSDFVDPYVK